MKKVIIESPYAGDVEKNVRYARRATLDSIRRGEAPFISHLLYTQEGILDDLLPDERALGIAAGHEWITVAELTAVYADLGVSKGMQAGIDRAKELGKPIEIRYIGDK